MISIFQGTLGSGKSASMVVDCIEHLLSGGVCAANFKLVDDWALKLADQSLWVRLGFRDRYKMAQDLYERFMLVGSVESLWKASEILIPRAKGKCAQQFEGRGRLYLDECQNYFNSREWQKNKGFIHFFSQSRKLKWDVILIAHNVNMIDKQIRPFIEFEVRFRNLQKVRVPVLGWPLSPIPAFLAISRYSGISAGAGLVHTRRVYPLLKRYASLYDSAMIFDLENLPDEPVPCGPAPTGEDAARGEQVSSSRQVDPQLKEFFEEMKTKWNLTDEATL